MEVVKKHILISLSTEMERGNYATTGPIQLNYIFLEAMNASYGEYEESLKNISNWKIIRSSGEYGNTNKLFNSLLTNNSTCNIIHDAFTYRGRSLWQFMPSYLWPNFYIVTQLIELLDSLILREEVIGISYVSNAIPEVNVIWKETLKSYAMNYKIPISHCPTSIDKFKFINLTINSLRNIKYFSYDFIKFFIIFALKIKLLFLNFVFVGNNLQKIFFISRSVRDWRPVQGGGFEDEQFQPIYREILKSAFYGVINIDTQYSTRALLSILCSKRDVYGPIPLISKHMFTYFPLRALKQYGMRNIQNKAFLRLESNIEFKLNFHYMNIPLFPAMRDTLKGAIKNLVPKCLIYYECARNSILKERPSAILLTYETGPWQRAFILAARELNVPTIGLQHAVIFENNYDYMHSKISHANNKEDGFSIPNYICVWGKKWADVLTISGAYPKSSVIITGNWKYDHVLLALENRLDQKGHHDVGNELNIGIFLGGLESLNAIRICLEQLKNMKNIKLHIRPHPADSLNDIVALIERSGFNSDVLYKGALLDMLSEADIVISQISTVVAEAALLGKRIILIDFQSAYSNHDYVQRGIGKYVSSEKEFKSALSAHLASKDKNPLRDTTVTKFIGDYFFKTDGKSASRVMGIVDIAVNHPTHI